ncbi:polysaccharide biosynthesis/export family protein [Polymorphobacter fuscus]|uniref:Polysaccharide export protein n=1 Tax=Sandarakinorhabdus fusca TaxID=1439888 RepID=A0A7C9GSM0_9SPHN|nr:polysaccharide export protein [Polymorphobacter fuscus]MQT15878.1 polysaccharide export protein [Polymorphobacter fuscus]
MAVITLLVQSGCTALGGSGPTHASIKRLDKATYTGDDIALVNLNGAALKRISGYEQSRSFATLLGDSEAQDPVLGAGDVLDISVWEAPPAVLFGAAAEVSAAGAGAQSRTVIQQVVATDGALSIPFVGRMDAGGKTPAQIEREIVRRLTGRANDPQAVVRLSQNDARNVTVLGEVAGSRRVPIGPRGERLLDVIASAGGTRQPVGQVTVQLSRGTATTSMVLDRVIRDPRQNIRVKTGDVVTLLYQPYSFIALGAIARNAEIPFEGGKFSLAQALGRTGGLRDDRANIQGVFIFRLEEPEAVDPAGTLNARRMENGRIPIVYQLNMSDPTAFFVAQDFVMRDKDVLYVSTAPGADLARFVSTVASITFSAISIGNVLGSSSNNAATPAPKPQP